MPTRKKKSTAIVGVFETRDRAEQALAELKRAGFTDDQLGMVHRNAEGKTVHTDGGEETYADEGAVAGLVAGAGAGALVGAGVLAGVIPVVGPIMAIGALGTILLNAAGGAAIAGIAGALIGWGIPEEDAEYYESEVQAGRFLVTVDANGRADEARAILHRFAGFDRTGWSAVNAYKTNYETDRAATATAGRATAGAAGVGGADRTVQLREEQLRAEKQSVSTGDVSVRKEVHTEHKTITVPVEREEVVIERRQVTGAAGAGSIKAEEIRIPVKEERVNVSKETVVKEEVSVGKRKVQDTKTVTGEVRKEELVVESEGTAKVRQSDKSVDKKRK